jgi:nitrate reductase alpha subunit
MIRSRLLKLWRAAKKKHSDPVNAWESIVSDPEKSKDYKRVRGLAKQ